MRCHRCSLWYHHKCEGTEPQHVPIPWDGCMYVWINLLMLLTAELGNSFSMTGLCSFADLKTFFSNPDPTCQVITGAYFSAQFVSRKRSGFFSDPA